MAEWKSGMNKKQRRSEKTERTSGNGDNKHSLVYGESVEVVMVEFAIFESFCDVRC
jgi:hypothetical protein